MEHDGLSVHKRDGLMHDDVRPYAARFVIRLFQDIDINETKWSARPHDLNPMEEPLVID